MSKSLPPVTTEELAKMDYPWNLKIATVINGFNMNAENAAKKLDYYKTQTQPSFMSTLTNYLTQMSNLPGYTWEEKVKTVIRSLNTPLLETIELLDKYCTSNCEPTYKTLITEKIQRGIMVEGLDYAVFNISKEYNIPDVQVTEVYKKYVLPLELRNVPQQVKDKVYVVAKRTDITKEQKIEYLAQDLGITRESATYLLENVKK